MKHTHADAMLQYAKDAQENKEPWKLWRVRDVNCVKWQKLDRHPIWFEGSVYEHAPKEEPKHIVNYFSVEAPLTEAPSCRQEYYVASVVNSMWYSKNNWQSDDLDFMWLKRGLVFKTKEGAIANAKAMCRINPFDT